MGDEVRSASKTIKSKVHAFIRADYPDAVFTFENGADIYWCGGSDWVDIHFYPSAEARDADKSGHEFYCCSLRGDDMRILNKF